MNEWSRNCHGSRKADTEVSQTVVRNLQMSLIMIALIAGFTRRGFGGKMNRSEELGGIEKRKWRWTRGLKMQCPLTELSCNSFGCYQLLLLLLFKGRFSLCFFLCWRQFQLIQSFKVGFIVSETKVSDSIIYHLFHHIQLLI